MQVSGPDAATSSLEPGCSGSKKASCASKKSLGICPLQPWPDRRLAGNSVSSAFTGTGSSPELRLSKTGTMTASIQVWLSGAGGALGQSVLDALLDQGHRVTALVHRSSSMEALENLAGSRGSLLRPYEIDLSQSSEVDTLLATVPLPDALVHLAGGFRPHRDLHSAALQDYEYLMDLNLKGAYLLLRALMDPMKQRGSGSIVAIGAKPALHPGSENALYAASKAALHSLVLHAAEEGRAHRVRANLIVPQILRTPANESMASTPGESDRWTDPEDISRAICWLISPQASGVTGAVIPMYGGLPG